MKREVSVWYVSIDWQDQIMEIVEQQTGKKYLLPLGTTIHVVMIGYPDREERDLLARELEPYMLRGHIIERISFEEANA